MHDNSIIPLRISFDSSEVAERLRRGRVDLNKRLDEQGLEVEIEEAPDAGGLYNLDPHTIHLLLDVSKAAATGIAGAVGKELITWLISLIKPPKRSLKIEIGMTTIHLKANSSERDISEATSGVAIAIGKSLNG